VTPLAGLRLPGESQTWAWLGRLSPPPARLAPAGDATRADDALRRLRRGEALLYRGDYRNARQLLAALGRRLAPTAAPLDSADAFRRERDRRLAARRLLLGVLVPVGPGWAIGLARAPPVAEALAEALGAPPAAEGLLPLRELLGAVGAHEWRRRGVEVAALGARIFPWYGVFAPVRQEYAGLVAAALDPLDLRGRTVFDVGTGTGLLAFLAARRGARVVASDVEPAAVACAADNARRLGLGDAVVVQERDLFPEGRADLVLCNPPWVPAAAGGPLDRAVYDPGSRFLGAFLERLPDHLAPGGVALLVLSDLAERLGLRPEGFLAGRAARSGLRLERLASARPDHRRTRDPDDPLHAARAGEVTTLWRLLVAGG